MRGRKTERFIPLPSLGSREGATFPSGKADLRGLIGRNSWAVFSASPGWRFELFVFAQYGRANY